MLAPIVSGNVVKESEAQVETIPASQVQSGDEGSSIIDVPPLPKGTDTLNLDTDGTVASSRMEEVLTEAESVTAPANEHPVATSSNIARRVLLDDMECDTDYAMRPAREPSEPHHFCH